MFSIKRGSVGTPSSMTSLSLIVLNTGAWSFSSYKKTSLKHFTEQKTTTQKTAEQWNSLFQYQYKENTRLVLNIAHVYPARLRKSETTRFAEWF